MAFPTTNVSKEWTIQSSKIGDFCMLAQWPPCVSATEMSIILTM